MLAVIMSGRNPHRFDVAGLRYREPMPLLWEHLWWQRLGRVVEISARPGRITARLIFDDTALAETARQWLLRVPTSGFSMGTRSEPRELCTEHPIRVWTLVEVSVGRTPGDPGARPWLERG